jgi:putative FmdB family regulatory protein
LPTYQYRCTECDHAFEQFQSFTDDALTVCPACGGRLRKVFNAVGVVFKGSGFYRNDSRGKDSDGGGSPAKETTTTAAGGSDSGSGSSSGSSDSGSSSETSTKPSSASSSPSPSTATPAAS